MDSGDRDRETVSEIVIDTCSDERCKRSTVTNVQKNEEKITRTRKLRVREKATV